jgi:hypothetical protein
VTCPIFCFMAGATPSTHTQQVQVWVEPNIPFHPRSHHSLLLATVPGQADAFNGTARRSLYNRLPFHGRLCRLVPGEGHPGLGIQGGIMGLQVRPQKSRTLFWHVYALSELGWSLCQLSLLEMHARSSIKPIAWVVGTHLHLARDVGFVVHQAMIVLTALVHPIIVGVTGSTGHFKSCGYSVSISLVG